MLRLQEKKALVSREKENLYRKERTQRTRDKRYGNMRGLP